MHFNWTVSRHAAVVLLAALLCFAFGFPPWAVRRAAPGMHPANRS